MIHRKKVVAVCRLFACLFLGCVFASCTTRRRTPDVPPRAVVRDGVAITLKDQKLTVLKNGKKVKDYSISSSKFGMGSSKGSNRTPLGIHAVTKKVGDGQPKGMVFKGCRPTGEVVRADSGRDPIVTRIIQLAGLESFNSNSYTRRIYIHGTPEEKKIGTPASYGCIRMRSEDVVDLYPHVYRGMSVAIESCSQDTYLKAEKQGDTQSIVIPDSLVQRLPRESFASSSRHSRVRRGYRSAPQRFAASRRTGSSNRRNAKTSRRG